MVAAMEVLKRAVAKRCARQWQHLARRRKAVTLAQANQRRRIGLHQQVARRHKRNCHQLWDQRCGDLWAGVLDQQVQRLVQRLMQIG